MSMHAVQTIRAVPAFELGSAVVAPQTLLAAQAEGLGRAAETASPPDGEDMELRRVFDAFVGETFFSQMLATMRKTLGEPAYVHGGQAERVFQGQLDQLLAERLSRSTASQLSGKMFELFQLQRPGA